MKAVARDASHGQGINNKRWNGPAFSRFAGYAPETGPPPLEKPNWSETPSLGFVGLLAQV